MNAVHALVPASADRDSAAIAACFLGPYGENDTLLEKLVVEFLRDHVYWRRNFHPEDPPAISTARGAASRTTWRSRRTCAASCTSSRRR